LPIFGAMRAFTVDAERGRGKNMMDVTGRESGTRIRKRDVVFLTAKLGYSRESTKSKNHSSSNISAIHKQSEMIFCRKSDKFSQLERKHGSIRSGVERKHKNERTATRQRATPL